MHYSPRTVALKDLDLEWDRYTCSYPRHVPALEDSLKRAGLLAPIVVTAADAGYRVVSGFRRALAARRLGWEKLEARILESEGTDDVSLFILGLEENLCIRSLNLIEKALAVTRLVEDPGLDPGDPRRAFYLERLGVKNQDREIARYLGLAGLEKSIKDFIVEKGLAEAHAESFLSLAGGDASLLRDIARRFRLTASQIKQVAESAKEIAERDGTSFSQVLEGIGSQADPHGKNPAQQRNAIIKELREKRLPDYSRIKTEIDSCLAAINGRKGITITMPPYLEGEAFSASLSFENAGALEEAARALLEFSKSASMARAVELLEK